MQNKTACPAKLCQIKIIGGAPMNYFGMMVAAREKQLRQEKIGCVIKTNK